MANEIYATIGDKTYTKAQYQIFVGRIINVNTVKALMKAGQSDEQICEIMELDQKAINHYKAIITEAEKA